MTNEANIIANLKTAFPQHIGDDAAVIPGPGNEQYVISKDLFVEDIHFRLAYFSPADLAHKALHINLSDMAAMGARPQFVLAGIAIPEQIDQKYLAAFVQEFAKACEQANITLIGGDTTKSASKLFISITAVGMAESEHIKYRSGARSGDFVCVAGNLGWAHLGLELCERQLAEFEQYRQAFLRPEAKINKGLWLGQQPAVTAMMDLSDGLLVDLKRLAEASNVQAIIDEALLNPTEDFISACVALGIDPIEAMLAGGEDYGLLVTVKAEHYDSLAIEFAEQFVYPITKVGHVQTGRGVELASGKPLDSLKLKLFSHFGE